MTLFHSQTQRHMINAGNYMAEVCLKVILALGSHIRSRAYMASECQNDLEAHLDHILTFFFITSA